VFALLHRWNGSQAQCRDLLAMLQACLSKQQAGRRIGHFILVRADQTNETIPMKYGAAFCSEAP
jgi:hypothetical protein